RRSSRPSLLPNRAGADLRRPTVAQKPSRSFLLKLPHARQHFRAEQLDRMQGPLAELRADDEVENTGAELVADPLHLSKYRIRAADDDLAERDAVGELASRGALALRHGIRTVIARLPHAFRDRLVLLDKADPRRQCAHIGKSLVVGVGDMEH